MRPITDSETRSLSSGDGDAVQVKFCRVRSRCWRSWWTMELVVIVVLLLDNYTGVSCRVGAGERGLNWGSAGPVAKGSTAWCRKGKSALVCQRKGNVCSVVVIATLGVSFKLLM